MDLINFHDFAAASLSMKNGNHNQLEIVITPDPLFAQWPGTGYPNGSDGPSTGFPSRRQAFAQAALERKAPPEYPFQRGCPMCSKSGGVCFIQAGREGMLVITCPSRFDEYE